MARTDKKAEQVADRKKHKAGITHVKAGRSAEPVLTRQPPTILEKETILIVCNGENTEPSYFNHFRVTSVKLKVIGSERNTVSLVQYTIDLLKENKRKYDQVWCVFDKDSFGNKFNEAIELAKRNKIHVACSNQAFEYWLILHFNNHQGGGMHRNEYHDKLNEHLKEYGIKYDGKGNKLVSKELFHLLEGIDNSQGKKRVELAIARAEKILKTNSSYEESSTTVHKLVKEIRKFTR